MTEVRSRRFGRLERFRVRSDSMATNSDKKLPWRSRKDKYLEYLRSANADALIVSAADKLHNARAILADYRVLGEDLWPRFNAAKEDQLWFYGEMIETLRQTRPRRRSLANWVWSRETGLWEVKGMFPVRLGIVGQLSVPFVCRS